MASATWPPGTTCAYVYAHTYYTSCVAYTMQPGQTLNEDWYCQGCTSSDGTLEWGLDAAQWDCPAGMTCTFNPQYYRTGGQAYGTSCWQPYPTCYVELDVTAGSTMTPNSVVGFGISSINSINRTTGDTYNLITIDPLEVLDLDIAQGSQVVSTQTGASGGAIANQTPAPIMVGQQVSLQAVSSSGAAVTNVQWSFDSIATTDVVATSYVQNSAVVGTPTPVQTGEIQTASIGCLPERSTSS